MKLANANENYIVPPIGRYKAKIMASEATAAKSSGAPMIKITGEVREPAEYAGAQFFDNMITDESFKGSGFGKKKLRGLGVNVDSQVEIPDSQIAAQLLGLEVYVDLDHEQIMDDDGTGNYTKPRFNMENGKQVPANKLVPKGYYTHAVQQAPVSGGLPQATQGGFQAPQGFQGAPQGFQQPQAPQFGAPQGGWQQPPQGFQQPQQVQQPVPQQQQFQGPPQPQFGFPGVPQGQVPQPQFQQPQQQFQPGPNGAQPPQQLPWAQQPQQQPQQPQAEAGAGGGGGRKKRGS